MQNMSLQPFDATYKCFPIAFKNKELEGGDKILLPPTALEHLARLQVQYPMQFEISNPNVPDPEDPRKCKSTHCGVLEFSAEEGRAYVPNWIMQNLLLPSGGLLKIKNVNMRKGTYVKLQPQKAEFTELTNPRVVLEKALRNFSCLTQGDEIMIMHGDKEYYLGVVEVKPGNAISIIETDVNLDFAPPKDIEKYEAKLREERERKAKIEAQEAAATLAAQNKERAERENEKEEEGSYFDKLGGGNTLNGKKPKKSLPSRGAGRSRLLGGGSSNSSSSSTDGDAEGDGGKKFEYHYKTVDGKKKLAKRTRKGSKFSAFSGQGHSMK